MEFDFRLERAGWAYADIRHDGQHARLTASYLSDALGDLLRAVRDLVAGSPSARCFWSEEPGEFWWVFENREGLVTLTIRWFGDQVDEPDDTGDVVFHTNLSLGELVDAIVDGAEDVLKRHGAEEYESLWIRAPFPEASLSAIRAERAR